MATKLYKQTFKDRRSLADVHAEIGQRGGLVVRVDQSEAGTTVYFEAQETPVAGKKAAEKIEEVSLKDVTKV